MTIQNPLASRIDIKSIYISCLIVLMHCGKEELLKKKLSPFNKICCLQDSIFWRSVEALEYKNGIIYISAIFNNRILCYNEKENKVSLTRIYIST